MNVTFYKNFSKRINSTMTPSGGTDLTCYIKDDCSVLSPVFLIDGIDLEYNYCKFNNRYYFITDITLNNNNIYEISCSVDVLATYKTLIGSYTAFVERAASSYDTLVPDNMLSQQQTLVAGDTVSHSLGWVTDYTQGTYIVASLTTEGTILYAFDSASMLAIFCNGGDYEYMDMPIGTALSTLVTQAGMGVIDFENYLGNIFWVPFAVTDIATLLPSTEDLRFGTFNISQGPLFSGHIYKVDTPVKYKNISLGSLTNVYNDFRRYDPRFSRYTLLLPAIGVVPVNSLDGGRDDLTLEVYYDFFTGEVMYRLRVLNANLNVNYEIGTYSGKFAVEVPLAKSSANIPAMVNSGVGMISSMVSENIAGSLTSAVDFVHALANQQPQIYSPNGNIEAAVRIPHVRFSVSNIGSKDFPTVQAGRPLYQNVLISTLSGYVKCGAASVAISGFDSEKEQVNNYLNSGFYYE